MSRDAFDYVSARAVQCPQCKAVVMAFGGRQLPGTCFRCGATLYEEKPNQEKEKSNGRCKAPSIRQA